MKESGDNDEDDEQDSPAYSTFGVASPSYGYQLINQQPLPQREQSASLFWLVSGILSSMFCCLPLGVAGTITAYLSKQHSERGDAVSHKRRLYQAKCLISWAIGVGLVTIISVSITVVMVFRSFNFSTTTIYEGGDYTLTQNWTSEGVYLGCYYDNYLYQDFIDHYRDFGENNSVRNCVSYCAYKGYKYAGLHYETQCICGHTYGAHFRVKDAECNSDCPADNNKCGGKERNSVYRTSFIGCFNDSHHRSLEGYSYTMESSQAIPKTCIERCGLEGYEFAGVQDSAECYCGNDPNRYGETDRKNCSAACLGDADLLCGGTYTNSVYKTDYNHHTNYNYVGCYEERLDLHLGDLIYDDKESSVKKCVKTCASRGYKYAGVQHGTQCFCSQSYGSVYERKDDIECGQSCATDSNKCGGENRNAVYRTYYYGCYNDDWGRSLSELVPMESNEVTPSKCIGHCEDRGYLFAGLQDKDQCYCGNDANRYGQAQDKECDEPCAGETESKCGEILRNSIFRTTVGLKATR